MRNYLLPIKDPNKYPFHIPEHIYNETESPIPKVTKKPKLAEYGLGENIAEELKAADEMSVKQVKANRKRTALIITAGSFLGACFVSYLLAIYSYPKFSGTFSILLGGIGLFSVIAFYLMMALPEWIDKAEPVETKEHRLYEQYTKQLINWEYWELKKDKDHWTRMSGKAFTNAIANLFRSIGFTANVESNVGVDIILQKNQGRRIAVVCKSESTALSVKDIRDFLGIMQDLGFNEGCFVSKSGFTEELREFSKKNKVYLIDLSDVIMAISDDGEKLLSQKLNG